MVAGVVGGGVVFGGGPDRVAEDLDDFGIAAGGCAVAEGGAAAVDTEGGGNGEEGGEGTEAEESGCEMHDDLLKIACYVWTVC